MKRISEMLIVIAAVCLLLLPIGVQALGEKAAEEEQTAEIEKIEASAAEDTPEEPLAETAETPDGETEAADEENAEDTTDNGAAAPDEPEQTAQPETAENAGAAEEPVTEEEAEIETEEPLCVDGGESQTEDESPTDVIVTLDANGGVFASSTDAADGEATITIKVSYDEAESRQYSELEKTDTPVRDDYAFSGWFTAASGGSQVTAATEVTNPEEHTLYAHWGYAVGIRALESVGKGVKISWNAVDGAVKYQLYRKASGGEWEKVKTVSGLTYTDTTALAGVKYAYKLRVYDGSGWSGFGPANSITFRPFTDVSSGAKYVYWAYNNGIVKGTGEMTFSPNASCTRANFVMMLWKMNGSPTVTGVENPFKDVTGAKTTNAVLWALQEGIIVSAEYFRPNDNVTRVNIVMMLWKMAGSPKVSVPNPFTDVTGTKTARAVRWAYQNGITKGTSETTFSPDNHCTRLQLVTFLYKFQQNIVEA